MRRSKVNNIDGEISNLLLQDCLTFDSLNVTIYMPIEAICA